MKLIGFHLCFFLIRVLNAIVIIILVLFNDEYFCNAAEQQIENASGKDGD